MLGALYGARLMNAFERRGSVVGMSAVSDLVNGWPGGIIQASRDGLFVTPIYLVNQLYATHLGSERLATRVEGPTISTTKEGSDVSVVDVVTSRSADGRNIFIKALNTDLERPVTLTVILHGARVLSSAVVDRVTAPSLQAVASFRTPNAVRLSRSSLKAAERFQLELPKHSVSVVTLGVAK